MPIIKSAKKALRQSHRRRERNRVWKNKLREAVKPRREWVGAPTEASEKAEWLANAYKAIDKSAKAGIIKKNKASRMKSRLARLAR